MRTTYATVLAGALLLASCGISLPQRPPGELFRGVEAPPEGGARVYIFRPGFSRVSESDSPTLLIDGKEIARLSVQSYTDVTVKPGSYVVSLKPNTFESRVWTGAWSLKAEGGQVYFLAIWNNTETYSSFALAPMPGGWFMPLSTIETRNKSIRFELVSKDDALPVISQQTYVPPILSSFTPAP